MTESGITIDTRLVQNVKAPSGMCVTPSGIVIDTSLVQPKKAPSARLVVESESTKDVIFDHAQMSTGIVVTESGMITDVVAQPVNVLPEMAMPVIVSAITIVPLVLHGKQRTATPRG